MVLFGKNTWQRSFGMSFYMTNFLALGAACSFLFFRQRSKDGGPNKTAVGNSGAGVNTLKDATSKFTRLYLVVYALTIGAD